MAYLAALNIFLGLGLAMGRGSSDAIFFKRFGVEYLPHMLFLTSLILVVVSMSYATIVDRLRPARLFSLLFAGFGLYLLLVWAAMQAGEGVAAFALYYVGYGVISELLVAHFNFYALGFFDGQQAKRLFPVISAAARLGAVLGGLSLVMGSTLVAPENIVLIWVATLAAAWGLVHLWHRQDPIGGVSIGKRKKHPITEIREGLRFAKGSKLLRVTALGMFIMILVISIQDYLASTLITHHFSDTRSLAEFFGWFFAITNGVVLCLQLFATNRLLRRFGLLTVNLIFPLTSVLSLASLTFTSGFWAALFTRFNYMGLLPAFRIPAANLFYNALPAYMQGRARALLMGLVLPAGLACSGLLLMLVPPDAVDYRLAALGLVLAVFYLWLKMRKNAHYSEALLSVLQQQVFSGRPANLEGDGLLTPQIIEGMKKLALESRDDESILSISSILVQHVPQHAGTFLLEMAPSTRPAVQNQMLHMLASLQPAGWQDYARACLQHPDQHLAATALKLLVQTQEPNLQPVLSAWLASDRLRLKATAATCVLHEGGVNAPDTLMQAARTLLDTLLSSAETGQLLAGISIVEDTLVETALPRLQQLIHSPEARVRAAALRAMSHLAQRHHHEIDATLDELAEDPSPLVRQAVLSALPATQDPDLRLRLMAAALDDPNHAVRQKVISATAHAFPEDTATFHKALHNSFRQFGLQSLLARTLAVSNTPDKLSLLQGMAERHINAARAKQAALLSLAMPQSDEHQGTLALLLSEEVQQHVNQVLEVMVYLDESDASQSIRAALASRNRHLRAQALESVRHIEHASLFKKLQPILEGEADTELAQEARRWQSRSWSELLSWCEQEGSLWLAQCAHSLRTV